MDEKKLATQLEREDFPHAYVWQDGPSAAGENVQVLLLLRTLRRLRILGILRRIRRILAGLLTKRILSRLPHRLTDGLSNRLSPETGSRLHARLTHSKRIF